MTKKELMAKLAIRSVKSYKSWTVEKLTEMLAKNSHRLGVVTLTDDATPYGNWTTAKDWFPIIEVDQDTHDIVVTTFDTSGFQKKASVETEWIDFELSNDGDQVFIRGSVDVRNWKNGKCSGSQNFCFALFVGDSGHVYTHRAPATKGWMNADAEIIRKRLRKLGIGAEKDVIQQGDFLLKPANGTAYPKDEFIHETMGAGHHNFEMPVLYAYGNKGRQYKITEDTNLIHTAVDGIQHPTITVPPGIYAVGTTANQLFHANAKD